MPTICRHDPAVARLSRCVLNTDLVERVICKLTQPLRDSSRLSGLVRRAFSSGPGTIPGQLIIGYPDRQGAELIGGQRSIWVGRRGSENVHGVSAPIARPGWGG
jgi:hypothetical protein